MFWSYLQPFSLLMFISSDFFYFPLPWYPWFPKHRKHLQRLPQSVFFVLFETIIEGLFLKFSHSHINKAQNFPSSNYLDLKKIFNNNVIYLFQGYFSNSCFPLDRACFSFPPSFPSNYPPPLNGVFEGQGKMTQKWPRNVFIMRKWPP